MNVAEASRVAIESAKIRARNDFGSFVLWTKSDYQMMPFHRVICDKLNQFERGEIRKMMVFMPPQHGKSELTTRRLAPYMLGRNPKRKVVLGTYSATLASQFNRDMQRVIDNPDYAEIFPETFLNESNVVSDSRKGYVRNSEIFETVGHRGFVKTVGRGGSLTGTPVDIGIIDDPLKDRAEALSVLIRESLWSWYTDVFETRLHNQSQVLIILTRWHEDDLAGRILERDSDWDIISFPAIKTKDEVDYDNREDGEALWPDRHSLDRLLSIKKNNPYTFNSLYQQTPQPDLDALVFSNWHIGDFDESLQVIYGQDYGFASDPSTLVKVAIDERNGKIYIDECFYQTGLNTSQIYDLNTSYAGHDTIIADSAEPRLIAELEARGLNIKPAEKGQGSVSAGLMLMQDYEIIVAPGAKHVQKELSNYVYLDRKSQLVIDDFNHTIDPVRYVVTWVKSRGLEYKPYYERNNRHAL